MLKRVIIFTYIFSLSAFSQETPNDYSTNFLGELKSWKDTFINFEITDFELEKTIPFNDLVSENKTEASIPDLCKPLASHAPNNLSVVDIYSHLNLKRIRGFYTSTPSLEQHAELYLSPEQKSYILFTVNKKGNIDETLWLSDTKLLIVGATFQIDNKKPFVLIVDTAKKRVLQFKNSNKNCSQKTKYTASLLKKMQVVTKK